MQPGENLWCAAELVSKVGSEINAMKEVLVTNLTTKLEALGVKNKFKVNELSEECSDDDSEWICLEWFNQWSITPASRRKATGWLYVQLVIYDKTGDIGPCGRVPRIEVGYSTEDDGEWDIGSVFDSEEGWEDYGLDELGYCPTKPKENWKEGKGVCWNKEDVEWFFCIPLFCLNTLEDINKMLISPSIKLLNGENPKAVFEGVPAFRFKLENSHLIQFKNE